MTKGNELDLAMRLECFPEEVRRQIKTRYGDQADKIVEAVPSFRRNYEPWYSEVKVLVKQLLPDRLSDFVSHYEKPKSRKNITYENYRIADYLQGLNVTDSWQKKVVGPDGAIPHFQQQRAILESVKARFESSLFDIRQLVQADLFDSELDAAKELAKSKFTRAAGALAGVVLEKHLAQVAGNHGIKITKKAPTISDLNDALRKADVIEVPRWRSIQHLGDIRNLCDHNKMKEPAPEQVDELIAGVEKATKTLF